MDFLNLLLTSVVITIIYNEPTRTSEKVTTIVVVFECPNRQYEGDFSFSPVSSVAVSENNANLPDETEDIPLYCDEYDVIKYHTPMKDTETVRIGIEDFYQDDEDLSVTTLQEDLDATPTVQVDINTTVANATSATQTENILLSAVITLLKLATVLLAIIGAALFITTILVFWNNSFISISIEFKILRKINSNDPELGEVIYQETFTI